MTQRPFLTSRGPGYNGTCIEDTWHSARLVSRSGPTECSGFYAKIPRLTPREFWGPTKASWQGNTSHACICLWKTGLAAEPGYAGSQASVVKKPSAQPLISVSKKPVCIIKGWVESTRQVLWVLPALRQRLPIIQLPSRQSRAGGTPSRLPNQHLGLWPAYLEHQELSEDPQGHTKVSTNMPAHRKVALAWPNPQAHPRALPLRFRQW